MIHVIRDILIADSKEGKEGREGRKEILFLGPAVS
jgi:hypothetical protein